jgi:hemoglobin
MTKGGFAMRIPRSFTRALLTVVLAAAAAQLACAADPEKPPALTADQKAFDMKLRRSLFDVINRGVDLYNADDPKGCHQLFDGSIRTIAPLLDHHPKLQKMIADDLDLAERLPRYDLKAWHLRRMLDKVREELKGETAGTATKTLWDKLGGEKGVTKLVNDFTSLVATNDKVDFLRKGKYKSDDESVAKLKRHLVELISSGTGGPLKYMGRDLKEVHKDMAISDAEFDASVADLKKALEKNEVQPTDADALLKVVESTRKLIVAPKKPDESTDAKTLWDRLGGEKGVTTIVDKLYGSVTKDRKLDFFRKPDARPSDEKAKAIREEIVDYISSKTGGPRKYEGKTMKAVHAGMQITDEQFDLFVEYFKAVLKNEGVKDDDVKTLVDAVNSTKKEIVEAKKPD